MGEMAEVTTKSLAASGCCQWLPTRVSIGFLAFLGFMAMTSTRINLSVAIVAMVSQNSSTTNSTTQNVQCHQPEKSEKVSPVEKMSSPLLPEGIVQCGAGEEECTGAWNQSDEHEYAEEPIPKTQDVQGMVWDEVTQGIILASFFNSYTFTQIIGGRLAEKFGTKLIFGLCGVGSTLLTLLTPLAARTHYIALIAVRVLLGLVQGPMWPAMQALVPSWVPPHERPRFVSAVYFGSDLSIMVTLAMCGVIIESLGWAAAFYIPGVLCFLWTVLWFVLAADTPDQHPRISQKEKAYINDAVRSSGTSPGMDKGIPWRAVFTSLPVWAIFICDIGNGFGLSIFYNQLPTFMKNILGFSIRKNGLLSSLPFMCRYIGAVGWGVLSDHLVISGRLSKVNARRIFSGIAMFGPATMCLAVTFAGCSAPLTASFLCLGYLFNGAIAASQIVNVMDISPNFSGTVFGISNTFFSVGMSIAPLCVGAIIQGQQTFEQWNKVFWMSVPVYGLTEIFYLIFCSATVQPWNFSGRNSKASEEEDSSTGSTRPMITTD